MRTSRAGARRRCAARAARGVHVRMRVAQGPRRTGMFGELAQLLTADHEAAAARDAAAAQAATQAAATQGVDDLVLWDQPAGPGDGPQDVDADIRDAEEPPGE